MVKSEQTGRCVECDEETNIKLNAGVYACASCLTRVALEQKNIYEALKEAFGEDFKLNLHKTIAILEIMRDNGCSKTNHCITSLKSFLLTEDYKNGVVDSEISEEITKTLDIFRNL